MSSRSGAVKGESMLSERLGFPRVGEGPLRDLVAWILPEGSNFNALGDSTDFEHANVFSSLAYPCNKVPVAYTCAAASKISAVIASGWLISER